MSPFEILKKGRFEQKYSFRLYAFVLLTLSVLFFSNIRIPLLGSHPWRQADTLFTGYFFCYEDQNILRPRIGQRQDTTGIAIGEFPLYSWLISVPCQLTGQWSEVTPKIISFVFFILISLLFAVAANRRLKIPVWDAAILFLCSELAISFLTRTLPDGLALLLYAWAGVVWAGKPQAGALSARNLFALTLTIVGFLIRPYLAPLAFVFMPRGLLRYGLAAFGFSIAYQRWFIEWTQTSTFDYYYVRRMPLLEALSEFPKTIWPFLRQTAKDHLNFVMLPFFILGIRKIVHLPLIWIGSFLLVAAVSASHFSAHAYYLFAPAVCALLLAAMGLPKKPAFRKGVLTLFAVIGIANTQHYFHKPRDNDWKITKELVDANSPYKTQIVTINSIGKYVPIWLYYAKRTGWSIWDTPENRASACLLGVDPYKVTAILTKEPDGQLNIRKCE